ncbi:hypothetical protein BJY16_003424 [Actinoplanes octamycinicus]|uniref:Lipoprotein n=1 Tax=Actinoplanes octamycinicus TaxID=135948 RepID=A0A7W7M7M2_9ACTN|nr:hypothetical protein [Actinoplanes octamycinicus]MBB4739965.1 hypothetical protein [Actinoplanes octamycinicus]GIE55150.1 hypothetical protein Aoc01nite_05520 [Actinoplanes octamycinicus]
MRFERALCAVALVGLVTGCSSSSDEPKIEPGTSASAGAPAVAGSAPAWTEPAAYKFTLTRGCDAAKPTGRYQATVQGGQVTESARVGGSAAAPDPSAAVDLGPVTGDGGEEIEVPTLKELVEMVQTTTDDGGEASTEFDTADGHPVKVTINVTGEPGGAECWSVSDYRVG